MIGWDGMKWIGWKAILFIQYGVQLHAHSGWCCDVIYWTEIGHRTMIGWDGWTKWIGWNAILFIQYGVQLYLHSTRSRGCWVVRCSGMCINKMFLILTKITEKNGILDVLIYSSENIVHLSNQFVNTMNSNDRINPRTTQRIPYTTRQWLHGTHPTCTGFAPGFPHKRLILFPFLGLDTRFRRQTGKNNARLMHVSCKA